MNTFERQWVTSKQLLVLQVFEEQADLSSFQDFLVSFGALLTFTTGKQFGMELTVFLESLFPLVPVH